MLNAFLNGAVCMANLVIALFFWRFWRRTHDQLFLFFTTAFYLLAAERILIAVFQTRPELNPWVYSVRLVAYVVIIGGIIGKNRSR